MEIMFLTSRGHFFNEGYGRKESVWRLRLSVLSLQPSNDTLNTWGADRSSIRTLGLTIAAMGWRNKHQGFPSWNNVDTVCDSVGFKVSFQMCFFVFFHEGIHVFLFVLPAIPGPVSPAFVLPAAQLNGDCVGLTRDLNTHRSQRQLTTQATGSLLACE